MAAQIEKKACNVTLACEACTQQMMNDQAEYCLKTGWRQKVTCRKQETGRTESKFMPCPAGTSITSAGPLGVVQMEMWCGACLLGALWYIRRRAARMAGVGDGGGGGKEMSGRYAPMNIV